MGAAKKKRVWKLSRAGREAISKAQKARWRKFRRERNGK